MTVYNILYGLLWAIVILMAVLPYVIAPMIFGFMKDQEPRVENLWPTFRLISVFLGLAVFGLLGSALLGNEAASKGMNFLGKLCYAFFAVTMIYLAYRSYKIGRGD